VLGNIFPIIKDIFIHTIDFWPNRQIRPNAALGKRIIENMAQIPNNHRPFMKCRTATVPFRNNPIKKTR
jgi:hypothetical protein